MNTAGIKRFRKDLRRFERLISNQLKTCCSGVTLAQCHVLLEIEMTEPATVQGLAERLGLDKSTLSRTVAGLVAKGAVKRLVNSSDRRVTPLVLTGLGRGICSRINSEADTYYGLVFERIPRGDHGRVLEGFGIIINALEESENPAGIPGSCGCDPCGDQKE